TPACVRAYAVARPLHCVVRRRPDWDRTPPRLALPSDRWAGYRHACASPQVSAAQPAMSLRSVHTVEEAVCPEVLGKVGSSLTAWVPAKGVARLGHDGAICQSLLQRLQQVEIAEPQGR